jgi:hypothetical protein
MACHMGKTDLVSLWVLTAPPVCWPRCRVVSFNSGRRGTAGIPSDGQWQGSTTLMFLIVQACNQICFDRRGMRLLNLAAQPRRQPQRTWEELVHAQRRMAERNVLNWMGRLGQI